MPARPLPIEGRSDVCRLERAPGRETRYAISEACSESGEVLSDEMCLMRLSDEMCLLRLSDEMCLVRLSDEMCLVRLSDEMCLVRLSDEMCLMNAPMGASDEWDEWR